EAGVAILRAAGLRGRGIEVISCPTCGRTDIDLFALVHDVETRLRGMDSNGGDMTVAVMGCAVNGPGEASAADYGIACGVGAGVIFKKGEIVKRAPADRLADELMSVIACGR
ncbi:MAG: flavodoxin-dependent (E)-4-hydroxy-3-methylbut-2-enyl-diphosphate synthase, partial [Oscillospiraceae bacterium]|nr:flavodoxin-dependent (E)-4-hydroxy-3-methylbut-2-enyl-diphosphate synthase [Oscillospiraceae bacterium]